MQMTPEVDVPDELLDAAAQGTLVLFVGAGASINWPSSLPLFDGLVRQIAEMNATNVDTEVSGDAFLGRISTLHPVREQARAITGGPSSKPNDLHRAIVRLASASKALQIVTTNYDEHLTHAADELGINLGDVYFGPAVPLGRAFRGLVHLHGAVSRPAAELILTDDDFGRAYLTDGWARVFVQDLFVNRTVLFIGYSHNDVVMKYLARGLPTSTRRFVLTDSPDLPRWKDLRIQPVPYPTSDDHAAASDVLSEWADRLTMGQLDHRARVHDIVSRQPPKLPVEADYIAKAITTPTGVRAFAERATGPEWLRWAENQPMFRALFTEAGALDEESQVLAAWFAGVYIERSSSHEPALATMARFGPTLSDVLVRAINWSAYGLRDSAANSTLRWYAITSSAVEARAISAETAPILHGMSLSGRAVLPFLRRSIRPRLVLSEHRRWYDDSDDATPDVEANIGWSGSESDVDLLWKLLRADLASMATEALQLFEQAILDAYELLDSFDPDPKFDSMSFGRSSISKHSQDRMRRFESNLIDGLRDCAVERLPADATILPRWLASEHQLFRRLGTHVLSIDPTQTADEKLQTLLDQELLFENFAKREVFALLEQIAPTLSDTSRIAFLDRTLRGPEPFGLSEEKEKLLHQRVIFDVLEWVGRFVRDWPELNREIEIIRADRPGIGIRDHPDFGSWSESGVWGGKLPIEVDAFSALADAQGIDAALRELANKDYSERNFDEPTWDDALSLIRQVVEVRADLGAAILDSAAIPVLQRPEVIAAAVRGWGVEGISDVNLSLAITHLESLASEEQLARPIAEVCLAAVGRNVEGRPKKSLVALDRIATTLWMSFASSYTHTETDDWSFLGLNTWPGFLAQYWIHRVRLDWREEGDAWRGLSLEEADSLTMMIETTTDAGQGALSVIASDLYFLFRADEKFAVETLFPIFDAITEDRAANAWMSFLHNPRIDDKLLDIGFWDLLVRVPSLLGRFNNRGLDSQYWALMGWICLTSLADSVAPAALLEGLAHEGSYAAQMIESLAHASDEVESDELENAWHQWMRDTMRMRCTAMPGVVGVEERSAWNDLALHLHPYLEEALTLALDAPAPFTSKTSFEEIPMERLTAVGTLLTKVIIGRVQQMSNADWHVSHELRSVVPRLIRQGADAKTVRALIEACIDIGIHDAPNWITEIDEN